MEPADDWAARADAWLDRDHALLTDDAGWRSIAPPGPLGLWSRRMPDDPNNLYRWRLPVVGAPGDVVFEGFVRRILDHHREWTREFVDGRVVETLAPHARILYQRFDPGVPGIAQRDLCSIEVVREVGPGVRLVSYRSVDRVPPTVGYERIDWWGAALITSRAGAAESELAYLDRENQGGWLPAWLTNLTMPHYLLLQAREVRRFFADGGPASLRAPSA